MAISKFYQSEKVHEWTVKRTFKDFEFMDNFLSKRMKSPQTLKFMKFKDEKVADWPKFMAKNPISINNSNEIEICRKDIERYIQEILLFPCINQAYQFKCFIDDPNSNF